MVLFIPCRSLDAHSKLNMQKNINMVSGNSPKKSYQRVFFNKVTLNRQTYTNQVFYVEK